MFKWIKQHLRIKRVFGTSENAVTSQVWIAVSTYVLDAIARKRLKLDFSLHTKLQVLSVTRFEKSPLIQLFSDAHEDPKMLPDDNQWNCYETCRRVVNCLFHESRQQFVPLPV